MKFMQAYKFETRISKTGQIKLPLNNQLFGKEVEIIIVPKQNVKSSKLEISDFIDKWSGFLTDVNFDDSKYQYLTEKYK
jgi:hypothetical protein